MAVLPVPFKIYVSLKKGLTAILSKGPGGSCSVKRQHVVKICVADPDHFDTEQDPAFEFDPDLTFQFDTDPDTSCFK
jgi:hypothetical protein